MKTKIIVCIISLLAWLIIAAATGSHFQAFIYVMLIAFALSIILGIIKRLL